MRRYAFVSLTYPPHIGGVARHIQQVHQTLTEYGYAGDVIVIGKKPAHVLDHAKWIKKGKLLGISSAGGRLRASIILAFVLARGKYDVWHFHDYQVYAGFMLGPIKSRNVRTKKLTITFHGWEGVCPPEPSVIQQRQKIAHEMDGIIAVGDYVQKWYQTPANVITYGGVDTQQFFDIGHSELESISDILYLGRLEEDTGIASLIQALSTIASSHNKTIPLRIYGDGSLRSYIERVSEQQKLDVTIHPPVPDVLPILQKSSIIFASGYLTILEALCARRVVLAFYDSLLREDYLRMHPVADSFLICGTTQQLAENILQCINSPETIIRKAEIGWKWAQTQSWKSVAEAYLEVWGWK